MPPLVEIGLTDLPKSGGHMPPRPPRLRRACEVSIEEHARLDFSDFLSTLLAIFHVINEKLPPACLIMYLVNKQAGWHFFPSLLIYSGLLCY